MMSNNNCILSILCVIIALLYTTINQTKCKKKDVLYTKDTVEKISVNDIKWGKFNIITETYETYSVSDKWYCDPYIENVEILESTHLPAEVDSFTRSYLSYFPKRENAIIHISPYSVKEHLNEYLKYLEEAMGNERNEILNYYKHNFHTGANITVILNVFQKLNNIYDKENTIYID